MVKFVFTWCRNSAGRVTFLPNGTDDTPLLLVQTKDLVLSCSNMQSDLKHTHAKLRERYNLLSWGNSKE